MGAVSVLYTAWTTAIAVLLAGGPEVSPTVVASAAGTSQLMAHTASGPALADAGLSADMPYRTINGFRMEGSAELDVVFGDIDHYRRYVDRFYQIDEQMTAARSSFSQAAHAALTVLSKVRRGCPAAEVAPLYRQARDSGTLYRRLGAEYEAVFQAIKTLDELGESSGLTPDYRWKVKKVRGLYRQALTDLEEMRGTFVDQLGREVRHRGCDLDATGPPPPSEPTSEANADSDPQEDVVPASTATFFVDNSSCQRALSVYVDGVLLGQVARDSKAAFQALSGQHTVCVIDANSPAVCGEPGTVRSAFIHDGWLLERHCSR